MKILAVFLFLLASSAYGCELPLDAGRIQGQLKIDNPRLVIERLWDNAACEDAMLSGLASGQSRWLDLAVDLRPYTDAWSSESLQDALGTAMQRAPSRVLPLIGTRGFDEGICIGFGFDDSPAGIRLANQKMRSARVMFNRFLHTKLAPQAQRCLKVLDNIAKHGREA